MHTHDVKTGAHSEKPRYVKHFPVSELYPRLHKNETSFACARSSPLRRKMSFYDVKHCDDPHRRHLTLQIITRWGGGWGQNKARGHISEHCRVESKLLMPIVTAETNTL
jgi:hypothetical protein